MNTLLIQNGSVNLIGFDQLKDTAYFIFREGGLIISGNKLDVTMPQDTYQINNRKITDGSLCLRLELNGFLHDHSFVIKDGTYYCPYPDSLVENLKI